MNASNPVHRISVFAMVMMTSAAVMSLRGLPVLGKLEYTLFFYLAFSTLLFLIPAALVAAELGGMFGEAAGGVYTWVKEAFGERQGFLAIWLQWIQNVVWYPTMLGFTATIFAYVVGLEELASNGTYTGIFCIVVYWLATWMTLRGGAFITKVTSYGFILGTIAPAVILSILAVIWAIAGQPLGFEHLAASDTGVAVLQDGVVHARWLPHITNFGDISFLAGVIVLFAGVEVHAVHANSMKNPQVQYPLALFFTVIIVFALCAFGAFAVAAILPYESMDVEAGLIQAFNQSLSFIHLKWAVPIVGILLVFGALASVTAWITGPSRGLLETAKEGMLPRFMAKINKNGMQINILLVQACIVTGFSCIYFIFKDVSTAWFLITATTVTLYLIMYAIMYAAGIRLRYTRPDMPRKFKIPGGLPMMWVTGVVGIIGVGFSFVVSFFPPNQLPIGNPSLYVGLVVGGTILFTGIPLLFKKRKVPGDNIDGAVQEGTAAPLEK